MSQNARYARVAHTKSRNGCKQCKKRRVKCDLRTPECSNCHRRREVCDYNRDKPGETGSEPAMIPSSSVAGLRAPLRPLCGEWDSSEFLTAMPAMDHSLSEQERRVWNVQAVQHLGGQAYLQHNVLALNALQRYLVGAEDAAACYAAACSHHLEASRIFRQTTSTINDKNWLGAYILCTSVIMFHFAVSQVAAHPHTFEPVEPHDFLETFFVLRQSSLLGAQLRYFFQGPLQGMIKQRLDKFDVKPNVTVDQAVSDLCSAVDELKDIDGTKSTLMTTAAALQGWVHTTNGMPRSWVHIIWWPAAVGQDYINLLEQHHPFAVVIFIYWCTILSRAPSRWYMEGWAARTVLAALKCLPSELDALVQWPREILELDKTDQPLALRQLTSSPDVKIKAEVLDEVQKYFALRSASTEALDEASKEWRKHTEF